MTSENFLRKLIAESAGRGVWVGLFPSPDAALITATSLCNDHSTLLHRDDIHSVRDLHVTLFHFGKSLIGSKIEQIAAACFATAEAYTNDQLSSVEGVIRLKNHLGLLVAPSRILRIRETLHHALLDRGIQPDTKFEGVPHMTLWKTKEPSIAPGLSSFPIRFSAITLVAGDNRINYEFADNPF